jgi:hypothetical protein
LHVSGKVLCFLYPRHDDERGASEVSDESREKKWTRRLLDRDGGAGVQQRHQMLIRKEIEQWS